MPGFNTQTSPSLKDDTMYRSYRWRITKLGEEAGDGAGISSLYLVYAKSVTLPSFTINNMTYVAGSGLNYKFAESVTWNDVQVIFYDTTVLYDEVHNWYSRIWNSTDGLGIANIYKQECKFELIDNAGNQLQEFTLKGAYPSSVSHGTLSYESNDMKILEVTFSYDWADVPSSV